MAVSWFIGRRRGAFTQTDPAPSSTKNKVRGETPRSGVKPQGPRNVPGMFLGNTPEERNEEQGLTLGPIEEKNGVKTRDVPREKNEERKRIFLRNGTRRVP